MVHVAIDARVPNGGAGGVQHVITGLACGFATADIPNLKRTWIVYRGHVEWLTPHLPAQDDIVVFEPHTHRMGLAVYSRAPWLVSRIRPHLERLSTSANPDRPGPLDAELQRRGVHVMHLPFQDALPTQIPYIYHPHDLQHRHLPHFFTAAQLRHRETMWRTRAERAAVVSVGTRTVAADLTTLWNISPNRIETIPLAPVATITHTQTTKAVGDTPLILYPASFWPHKNHVTLIRAAAQVRDAGTPVRLLFPGALSGDTTSVRARLTEAGFNPTEVMPGFVADEVLTNYYADATVVAIPSLFEAASFPIWEAFATGTPVVASTVTALPGQVGDAGLLADPHDVVAWAVALQRILTDGDLRHRLAALGYQRLHGYSWERFARAHTAVYRRIAGEPPQSSEVAALREGPTL